MRMAAVEIATVEVAGAHRWRDVVDGLRTRSGFWLLESTLTDERVGGWSFAGCDPYASLRASEDRIDLIEHRMVADDGPPARTRWRGDPFEAVRDWLPRTPAGERKPSLPPFVGGAVGWFGYELASRTERLSFPGLDNIALPDLRLALVDRVLAWEHETRRLVATALGFGADVDTARRRAERGAARLAERVTAGAENPFEAPGAAPWTVAADAERSVPEPLQRIDAGSGLPLGAWFDESTYGKAVETVREHILAGDLYQANLTHRLAARVPADPWRVYRALARRNPAPFAAFLSAERAAVVGSSPERFLRIEPDGCIESRPIKGTRPRGATPSEDAALRAALGESVKERAENVMIVDLMRNDLGRVCVPGSIEVPELFALEPYATVWQMVSSVRGRLRPGLDVVDALRAAFPPGSMTGAPKVAAIELLARLEPVRRGVYAGALGWLDVRGGAELAVVIRTLLLRPGRAWLHVGGGIVLDSEPAAEWAETLAKARAPLDALADACG
jgi:aminodeoxychorismate synthase component I